MRPSSIQITSADFQRLQELIELERMISRRLPDSFKSLENELNRAVIADDFSVPPDVVTLNSQARLVDESTGEVMVWQLVLPEEADVESGKISILAPIGTAMLGYRAGDVFEWDVPGGTRRIRVEAVLFQPEHSELARSAASARKA